MVTDFPKMALEVNSFAFAEKGCFFSGQSMFAKRTLTRVESVVSILKVSPSVMATTFPVKVWEQTISGCINRNKKIRVYLFTGH